MGVGELKTTFSDLMRRGDYSRAYYFLLKNPVITRTMTLSELNVYYRRFKEGDVKDLKGLLRILRQEVFGEDFV